MSLWNRDRESFRKRYYEGEPYISTPYTEFGNKVGGALETGELFDDTLQKVPRYSEMEYKIEEEIEGVPFLMFLDSFDPESLSILEYKTGIKSKTGEEPWNNVKVRQHIQLPIYTLGVAHKHGAFKPDITLVWMETKWSTVTTEVPFGSKVMKQTGPGLKLTGRVEKFNRTIAEWELERMRKLIRQAAEEITEDFSKWKRTGN